MIPSLDDNFLTKSQTNTGDSETDRRSAVEAGSTDSLASTGKNCDSGGRDVSSLAAKTSRAAKTGGFHNYPLYSPRFWHGMRPKTWWRLLREGRFRFSVSRLPMVISVSIATPTNAFLSLLQTALFGRKIAAGELHGPPVFIVGHWRSGTTLLHELMVKDERYSSPSTFQCFAPEHFLVTEWFFRRFASWLLPGKRPMDNMDAGWDRPQEDEFALLTMGQPSPYRRIAFPNNPPVDMDYLDFEGLSKEGIAKWLQALKRFLITVSTATGRPLIIKSPTHTGRIAYLAKEFPDAKFIHIARDPRDLFPSTCRLWRGLDEVQALQKPQRERLESYVVQCMQRMYAAFHQQREAIDPSRIVDIRYEDLIRDPVASLQCIYETLRLSDFDSAKAKIEQWATGEHRQYKTNQHQLSEQAEMMIREAWNEYFSRYGYE
ncbi:MAG: sulfotransferase [Planctomycetota bacterium]|nr:sulfotransferase [Planctomycetota bacterium]